MRPGAICQGIRQFSRGRRRGTAGRRSSPWLSPSASDWGKRWGFGGKTWILAAGKLHVRQAMHRAGGDPSKRRQLFAEQKRLTMALKATAPAPGTRDEARLDLDHLLVERRSLKALVAAADPDAAPQAQADLARNAVARGRAMKALKIAPIDAARGELRKEWVRVRKALKSVTTTIVATEPKTERSRRTIAMPDPVVQALKAHRQRQLEVRLSAGGDWQERGLVFTTRSALRWRAETSTRRTRQFSRRQGCRTCASMTCATPQRLFCCLRE